jgi:hypothetical protein
VKAGAGLVVRNPNIGAQVSQLIERASFRRPRVCRRQDANLATSAAAGAQRIEQGRDAAPPDECHDDVDPVSRVNLGEHVIADSWLTWRIREQGRVEEGNQRDVPGEACLSRSPPR